MKDHLELFNRDDIYTFEELLLKDGSLSTHHRNIHALAIEMYKSVNSIALDITQDDDECVTEQQAAVI